MSSPRGTGADGGDVCTRTPGVTANIVEAGKMPCKEGRDLFHKIDSKVRGIHNLRWDDRLGQSWQEA